MRPEVWAPNATRVDLVLADGPTVRLAATGDGWFGGGPDLDHGARYGFSLDGSAPLPDPRSRWQPDGVHGLSAVDDPRRHTWTDDGWRGLDLLGGAIYELHVGTFSASGTLDAAIEHLDHVAGLGVAAVELMPVAEAMGERGWGYDGVDLWAVHHAYGGPAALRRFVDAAHRRGLGVLLDVVYNHLGPEGNHLGAFGPYFTDRHTTPWGPAVNLDGPGSAEVRRFIVDNAVHWCVHHHIDGLRVDATHHLIDDSPVHIVGEVVDALRRVGRRTGRRRWVVVEREQAEHLPLLSSAEGGWGADARWGDDLHHAIHAHLTGERTGYYGPFGSLTDIATVARLGHLPPGEPRPAGIAPERLVTCSQNHDQIGNRPGGERLEHLAGRPAAVAAAAIVLLGPGTPLLFQGEEWAASATFPFFCDTDDEDLAERIRTGRHEELEPLGWAPEAIADPLDPAVFAEATLDWSELADPGHAEVLEWYRQLLRLRGEAGAGHGPAEVEVVADEARSLLALRRGSIIVLVSRSSGREVLDVDGGELVLQAGAVEPGDDGALALAPGSTAVLRLPGRSAPVAGVGAWAGSTHGPTEEHS
jgi:maltooligosyltrehalose trehalohydrolase